MCVQVSLMEARVQLRAIIEILHLSKLFALFTGAAESGKSTLAKQMRYVLTLITNTQ